MGIFAFFVKSTVVCEVSMQIIHQVKLVYFRDLVG